MPTRKFSSLYVMMKLHSLNFFFYFGIMRPFSTLLFYIKVVKATFLETRNLQHFLRQKKLKVLAIFLSPTCDS